MSQSPSSAAAMGISSMLPAGAMGTGSMGIGSMLDNGTGIAQDMTPDQQHPGQDHPQLVMDRPNSPHSYEYSGPINASYPSPSTISPHGYGSEQTGPMNASYPSPSTILPPVPNADMPTSGTGGHKLADASQPPPRVYPCSTCGKGFVRKSDLHRHERIHNGVRPHACDYPGCGKTFIQRTALTVHLRVHTGEKPHLCEHCAKPFSDSSSLARHRRTHSGTRPYRCPYADCQKTFTRSNTLRRHLTHHTGTIEEAERAREEALARGAAAAAARFKLRSEGEQASNHGSLSTESAEMNVMHNNSLSNNSLSNNALSNNSLLPNLCGDVYAGSLASTTSSGYYTESQPTSHPSGYGPAPATLEPNSEHQQGPGGAARSPHLGSIGSVGRAPPGPGSLTHSLGGNGYVFPGPDLDLDLVATSWLGSGARDGRQE
ncbi:hypothetical protein B0T26DRAFT_658403 [Lasiosphaeria miniovina]|uniref:pH-response transcription factor pacC/RIM101 n=1 Tax=Lasiosphaeria miniovina TaxID=1954250 RepID=A0AA40DH29_9PEZI|nr:uncharacterized protein B0T26DRAFT_658403 [Lasiosphaeria miniovina]KAK0703249.1 hypothetical protein B0T26DRAFT_658403 [Lasiosphaeria miniovina]